MHKKPTVGIVVLNYNGGELTAQCIKSLVKNTDYNFRTILVDNGSTDGSLEKAKQLKGITILSLKENYGFSKGMNMGAWYLLKHHMPKYVMFVNNDMRFPPGQKDWLSTLIKDLEEDPIAATVFPKFKYFNGQTVYSGANYATNVLGAVTRSPIKESSKKQYINCGYAGIVLIKTKVLQKIGLFDERFSPFWYEDFDLDRRMEKAGYKILYEPAITLYHAESLTLKKIGQTKGQDYMKNVERRNFIRYAYKHYPVNSFAAASLYWFARQFIQRKGSGYALRNPFKSLGQRMIDFRREKVRLHDNEAASRIKEIIQL